MNGQLYQICCIAAAAKRGLVNSQDFLFVPSKYDKRVEFQFLPEKRLFSSKACKAGNPKVWFDYCQKKGLQDIKLLAPVSVKDRYMLGFSNMTKSLLVCFYPKHISYFDARWEFDKVLEVWNILYTEHEWKDAPSGKPSYADNTEAFLAALAEIKKLALKLGSGYFADVFQNAINILSGKDGICAAANPLPDIPAEKLPLFEAACTADVFGSMGSWNDSPAYDAHEADLGHDYETLSDELLRQIRLAILYAINEW